MQKYVSILFYFLENVSPKYLLKQLIKIEIRLSIPRISLIVVFLIYSNRIVFFEEIYKINCVYQKKMMLCGCDINIIKYVSLKQRSLTFPRRIKLVIFVN